MASRLAERVETQGTGFSDLSRFRKPAAGFLPRRLTRHAPIGRAYRVFGRPIKVCMVISVEPNPWDRAVSAFFWSPRRQNVSDLSESEQKTAFKQYVFNIPHPVSKQTCPGIGSTGFCLTNTSIRLMAFPTLTA